MNHDNTNRHEPPVDVAKEKSVATPARKLQNWRENQKWKTEEKWKGNEEEGILPKWQGNTDEGTPPK